MSVYVIFITCNLSNHYYNQGTELHSITTKISFTLPLYSNFLLPSPYHHSEPWQLLVLHLENSVIYRDGIMEYVIFSNWLYLPNIWPL